MKSPSFDSAVAHSFANFARGRLWRVVLKLGLILSIGTCAAGCAVSKQVTGPNGEILHAIDCSGWALTMGDCFEKAGKLCGSQGYELIGGYAANHGNSSSMGQFGYFSAPMINRELIVRCKGSEQKTTIPAQN